MKDAEVIRGLFTFYKTEDKVLLEIQPNQFDKTYMFSLTCESGLGEGDFMGIATAEKRRLSFIKKEKTCR